MPKYLTISGELQLVRGEGCRFVAKRGLDLESVEIEVSGWVEENATHPDVAEANRWLEAAALITERIRKERELANKVAVYREGLVAIDRSKDGWDAWSAKRRDAKVLKYEMELRREMGLD